MNERLREKTYQKRLKFSKSLMSNPVVQQRLAQYKAEEEARRRAAQKAADRAPREGRTRSQNEPRRSGRLGG
jgi:alkylation response protein AidB-like acyl-CoA dehydrogenase